MITSSTPNSDEIYNHHLVEWHVTSEGCKIEQRQTWAQILMHSSKTTDQTYIETALPRFKVTYMIKWSSDSVSKKDQTNTKQNGHLLYLH